MFEFFKQVGKMTLMKKSRSKRPVEASIILSQVVNVGVGTNFEPRPSRDLASRGAHFVGVRSWKARFDGIGSL